MPENARVPSDDDPPVIAVDHDCPGAEYCEDECPRVLAAGGRTRSPRSAEKLGLVDDSTEDTMARAQPRAVCPVCSATTLVTAAGAFRKHKRREPGRWQMVTCEGSGATAPASGSAE
jgi:hypothetical protein